MDFYEQFSLPAKVTKTRLATLFTLRPRKNIPKRDLTMAFDARHPLVDGFTVQSAYWLVFRKGGKAGGHYHERKREIFMPLRGSLSVGLKDVKSGNEETLRIAASESHALYIPAGVSHLVTSEEDGATLLVLTDSPATQEDTYEK